MIKASVATTDDDETEALFGYFLIIVLTIGPTVALIALLSPIIKHYWEPVKDEKLRGESGERGPSGKEIEDAFIRRMSIERNTALQRRGQNTDDFPQFSPEQHQASISSYLEKDKVKCS